MSFQKVKTEHHILKDFHTFLRQIEVFENIKRIIPGRISRKQSGSAGLRIHFSYETPSGLKYLLIKGSTAQELFVICKSGTTQDIKEKIDFHIKEYL